MAQSERYDMPVQMFALMRGMVNEELAEIYNAKGDTAKAKVFAKNAYETLSHDEMFKETCPERLERLQHIKRIP